jgi:hypothetical protein
MAEGHAQSYVEIGVQKLEVLSENTASNRKRLIREQAMPSSKDLVSNGVALVDEIAEKDIAVDSVLDRSMHTMRFLKPAALLGLSGPGMLQQEADDKFDASVSSMHHFSKGSSFDCSAQYGERMLEKLMEDRFAHHLCNGKGSSITCHERYPFDTPRYMCELKNVMLSKGGTTVSDCEQSEDFDSFFRKQGITEHNVFGKWTDFGGLRSTFGDLQCTRKASRKALVQVPADIDNFYEWYGDWVTLWETMAAMGWKPKDVDLYLLDRLGLKSANKYRRPFDEAWERAFPDGHVHVGQNHEELFGSGTCFSQLVTVPQGELSTMTFRGGRAGVVGCSSPTVMASALYLQALFVPSDATSEASKKKRLTLMLRRGKRQFESDMKAINAVKEVLPSDWSMDIYRPEDMENLTTQLTVVANTQLLVGVHGAGMMHVLFLPPKARIVEIFCEDRPRQNHHYRNLEVMGNPDVGPHLFSYYFEAASQRCKVDKKVVSDAIKAYDNDVAPPTAIVSNGQQERIF